MYQFPVENIVLCLRLVHNKPSGSLGDKIVELITTFGSPSKRHWSRYDMVDDVMTFTTGAVQFITCHHVTNVSS